MQVLLILEINRQTPRIMYITESKDSRNNSFDAGDKHFKISFSQISYGHEQDSFQRHYLESKKSKKSKVYIP